MSKNPINLIYLKYFCDAVKHGSITQSAKENFVSQSAISQGIGNLEKTLNVGLITHQANRFKTTSEGDLLFEKAKYVFHSIQELEESLEKIDGEVRGRIDFACMHSFALALLSQPIKKSIEKWPQLNISFRLSHTDIIKEMVRKGMVDFGIVLDNEDLSAFHCIELYRGEYHLYVSKGKAGEDHLPFIISEEQIETNLLKRSYRKHYGKEMNILMEVSSWEVIANLTEQGIGVGFFPDYVAKKRNQKLKVFDQSLGRFPYKIYAIFPKTRKISVKTDNFLSLLKKTM